MVGYYKLCKEILFLKPQLNVDEINKTDDAKNIKWRSSFL